MADSHPVALEDLNAAVPAPMPMPMPSLYKREFPDSQESYLSAASSTFSAPQLPSSSSNLSTSTAGDTEITFPPLSKAPPAHRLHAGNAVPPSPSRPRGQDALRIDAVNATRTRDTTASPMSMCSPMTQGLKRAADGSVKGSETTIDTVQSPAGHKRNKSMEAGSNGRIGQLSAQLKTRLSYAMVKVQNNWEKQSLDELEDQISQHGSPISVTSRTPGSRPVFDSPTTAERRRRPSGVSDNSDQVMISPGQSTPSDPSRSLATTPSCMCPFVVYSTATH
ncbi:hypothetical protein N0V90_011340 [Kalmusia sp. IMI 367209]|nr:hypothetical protein N0V90_011340 [Kalmusia sp. IMI 367209]